jgi:hypothetical protein
MATFIRKSPYRPSSFGSTIVYLIGEQRETETFDLDHGDAQVSCSASEMVYCAPFSTDIILVPSIYHHIFFLSVVSAFPTAMYRHDIHYNKAVGLA